MLLLAHVIEGLVAQLSSLRFNVGVFIEFDVAGVKVTTQLLGNGLTVFLPCLGFLLNAVIDMKGIHVLGTVSLDGGMEQCGGI